MCDPSYIESREAFAWSLVDMILNPQTGEGEPCIAGAMNEAMAFASILDEVTKYLATLRYKQRRDGDPDDLDEVETLVRIDVKRRMIKEMHKTVAQIELHSRRN